MRIGQVAALAGVPTATVRYYERRGLIAQTTRTASGYRFFGHDAARRLRFIKHVQALGFSLDQIQRMLELRAEDPAACGRIESTTREKILEVQERLGELRNLERTLQRMVRNCEQHSPIDPCPILAVLSEDTARVPRRRRAHVHA